VDRFSPDFGFLQFQVTDTVCHQFPGDLDAVQRVYEAVDQATDAAIEAADPETVVVASDHGIGPCEYRVAPNETLREAGMVSTTRDGEAMPTWSDARDSELRGTGRNGLVRRALTGLGTALARLGLTSQRIGRAVDAVGATELVLRYAPDELVRAGSERVDFPGSSAYVRSRVECGVRLNLVGRDPDGVVRPDEYDAVRERVVETLRGIETSDGEPVFETVAPREEFFAGPHAEESVDVVAIPRGFEGSVTSWLTGSVVEPFDHPEWDHKRDGVVAVAGEAVSQEAELSGAHLFDVAPTVLASMGFPMGTHMDGRVLGPVAEAGTTEYPEYEPAGEPTETGAAVEERLSQLGYIE
jgi:predicted AlkP superfamily phosphohydrolase/phosphomutase